MILKDFPRFTKKRAFSVFLLAQLFISGMVAINATSFARAVSSYRVNTDVRLQMTYNIRLQSESTLPYSVYMWVNRYSNWTGVQNSTLVEFESPYPAENTSYDPYDIHNNSYDYYEMKLRLNDYFQVEYTYDIDLAGRSWDIPSTLSLNDYNKTSDLYTKYTRECPYFEVEDPSIQGKAQQLAQNATNLSDLIENVYLFVVKNMKYTIQSQATPKTAVQALSDMEGDCSEFSSLMVTLLRAAGIPARKSLGIGIVEGDASAPNLRTDLEVGDQWTYTNDELPAHAWVQYYIPGLGWVSADPTWGGALYDGYANSEETVREKHAKDYLNAIDYLHLTSTNGDWYSEGIDPELLFADEGTDGLAEFSFQHAIFMGSSKPEYNYRTEYSFEVLEVKKRPSSSPISDFTIWALSGSGLVLMVLTFVLFRRKKSSDNDVGDSKNDPRDEGFFY